MKSRKGLVIALVSVSLVAVAAIVAVVGVLAATTQRVTSAFTVTYNVAENINAEVFVKYGVVAPGTGLPSDSSLDKTITAVSLNGGDAVATGAGSENYTSTNSSLVVKFTYTNKSAYAFTAALTGLDLSNQNLKMQHWNGSSWGDFTSGTKSVSVAAVNPSVAEPTGIMYVRINIVNTNISIGPSNSGTGEFTFDWTLTT